jgi:hypothetical protein
MSEPTDNFSITLGNAESQITIMFQTLPLEVLQDTIVLPLQLTEQSGSVESFSVPLKIDAQLIAVLLTQIGKN